MSNVIRFPKTHAGRTDLWVQISRGTDGWWCCRVFRGAVSVRGHWFESPIEARAAAWMMRTVHGLRIESEWSTLAEGRPGGAA